MAKAAGILPAGRNPSAPEGSVKPAPPPNPPKAQEIEALRAEVERVTCELMDAITRADKLAEALREAADDLERGIDARIVVAQLRARADLLREQEEGNE